MTCFRTFWRSRAGNQAVGLVLVVPLVALLLGVFWVAGRYANADSAVQAAANAAARDASLARSPEAARKAARDAAQRVMNEYKNTCVSQDVVVDVRGFSARLGQPANTRVTVRCVVANDKAIAPGFPGTKKFEQSAISPIDQLRER